VVEPIDAAHEHYKAIRPEIAGYLDSIESESDTRLKIIDRILVDVLNWPYDSISTEPHVAGGFVDYVLLSDGLSRVVVEAKRDGRSLGTEMRRPGASHKLSSGVFVQQAVKEGIDQAIRYCGERSAELACVTNGSEWIVFRGSRLGDGHNTRDGMAFVFPSLIAIDEQFALFYDLLSRDSASTFAYRPRFREAEGHPIRTSVFQKSMRHAGSARQMIARPLSNDIDKIMGTYFQRLTGEEDPGMLEDCFVETNESHHADQQIARIADSIIDRIKQLDTGQGKALAQLVERVSKSGRHEFVLIVGTKGAGKTTFITRFFRSVLDKKLLAASVVLRVDLRDNPGDNDSVVNWLDQKLIEVAEAQLFDDGQPSFLEIQGMFYDEYRRLRKGSWAALYASDETHASFHMKFGEMVEDMRRTDKHQYLRGLLRHVVTNRQHLPILVFDNADHFDISFQQSVYQYARSLYEAEVCLVIMPITDRTSWQLSKYGALQSFEHESFFLPAPRTEDIIRKRIDFVDQKVELERVEAPDRYMISGSLSISVRDLTAFTRVLQRVFLQTSSVSDWIGNLANHDVRRTLALARSFISSPHLRVDDLVSAYLSGSALELPNFRAVKALVRQKYDIYPVGMNEFVQNIFALNLELATTPLLGLRILQLLSDVTPDERREKLIDVEQVQAYCSIMGIEDRAIRLWLDQLLKTGLILAYDPTTSEIEHSRQIEISPSGWQHLNWALWDFTYLSAMVDVTPILTRPVFDQLVSNRRDHRTSWHQEIGQFLEYLIDEDAAYCTLPSHETYESQTRLTAILVSLADRLTKWGERSKSQKGSR